MTLSANKQALFFAGMFAIASTGLAFAESARPASTGDVPSQTVIYRDLNIDTPDGAKALYARVREAAAIVCSPYQGGDLPRRAVWKKCVDRSVDNAVDKINSSLVTAIHGESVAQSHAG